MQTELPQVLWGAAINKLLEVRRHIAQLHIATTLDLAGDRPGNIFRAPLCWIEGDNPDRLAIFSG